MLANVSAIGDLSLPFANANRLPAPIRAQLNIVELQHPVRNDYNGCSVLCGVLVFDMHEW